MLCKTFLIVGSIALSACSGGGDNAGTCSGSAEVCGLSQPASASASTAASTSASAASPNAVDLVNITCSEILEKTGSKSAAFALAQIYLAQGATKLDRDGDGVACDEYK
jgi:hypothetical protein